MTCPTCGGELTPGATRCPVCDPPSVPRVEGALAADPRPVTPPARARARQDPPGEKPGTVRNDARDRAWRDEVQQRVRSRRQKRADAGLPLFDEPETSARAEAAAAAPVRRDRPVAPDPASGDHATVSDHHSPLAPELSEVELADLPLRPELSAGRSLSLGPDRDGRKPRAQVSERPLPSLDDEELLAAAEGDAEPQLEPPLSEPLAVERPARPGERAQAAAVDAALFAIVAAVVVYFTGRTARVGLEALAPAWPWLAAYQGLLAAFYAGYFTGTTGQTPGKLITGLRVVDTSGRPPGYLRAAARAVAGLLGIALGGIGLLPMAFDPAVRAAHDRLFQTRVVRH